MKVKCIYNRLDDIAEQHRIAHVRQYMNSEYIIDDLEIGESYTVYNLLIDDGVVMYDLCVDSSIVHPELFPHIYFDVVDDRISRYWKLHIEEKSDGTSSSRFLFEAWADDPLFDKKLIEDEDPETAKIFQKYKSLMDNEFV